MEDPYLWLEDVTGEKPLAWAREQNRESVGELGQSDRSRTLQQRFLEILDSEDKIPGVNKIAGLYYNFWRDAKHPRGLWRRTALDEYRKEDPNWEIVIDLDALAQTENENWVWHGADVLKPEGRYCIIALSRGGADADVKREFDLVEKRFVRNGFSLPEAKSAFSWCDHDRALVATDFGPGSMTTSGYPRIVKVWQRGMPLEQAVSVFEGRAEDMLIIGHADLTPGFEREFIIRRPTFWTRETFLRRKNQLIRIEIPDDAKMSVHREWLFVELRSGWRVGGVSHAAGALLAIHFEAFLKGNRDFDVLFQPAERKSLASYSSTKDHVLLNELDHIRNRLYILTPPAEPGRAWTRTPLSGVPEQATASVQPVDAINSNDFFLDVQGYLTPPALAMGTVGKASVEVLKESPSFFNTNGLEVTQHEATSLDGTKIPYFQVAPENTVADGTNRTLLYGYGGFEIPMLPGYNALAGAAWLERGNVYIVANIRGGGEFGPGWHQAALKANRHKAYEDFIAVGEDLIRRKMTSPQRLVAMGGSNGGLLMGNMLTMRPDLFKAIACRVPLLDMRRYHKLLAGASWMGEYGNPDLPEEWEFIKTFSPYHNIRADVNYPRTLFTSSTRDDRVHPAHARKMVAKMKAQGHDVLYYENIEGGHGGAANNAQQALLSALVYSFFENELD